MVQMMDPTRYSHGWHPQRPMPMKDPSKILCQQFQQFGFCPRNDVCPFAHPSTFFASTAGSLYQQYNQQEKKPVGFFAPKKKLPRVPDQQDRFTDSTLEDFVGKIYDLCKDQNGCRFLQKKIEEKDKNLEIVYNEIHPHFTELMTGTVIFSPLLLQSIHTQSRSFW